MRIWTLKKTRIAKDHEDANMAIEAAVKAPCGGCDTPRTGLLWSIAEVLDGLSDEDWDLEKEMIGWTLCSCPLYFWLLKTFGTTISVRNDVC